MVTANFKRKNSSTVRTRMGGAASLISGGRKGGEGGTSSSSGNVKRADSRRKSMIQRVSSAAGNAVKKAVTVAERAAGSASQAIARTTSSNKADHFADPYAHNEDDDNEPVGVFDGEQSDGSRSEPSPPLDRAAFAGKIRVEVKDDEDPNAVPPDSPSGSKLVRSTLFVPKQNKSCAAESHARPSLTRRLLLADVSDSLIARGR